MVIIYSLKLSCETEHSWGRKGRERWDGRGRRRTPPCIIRVKKGVSTQKYYINTDNGGSRPAGGMGGKSSKPRRKKKSVKTEKR